MQSEAITFTDVTSSLGELSCVAAPATVSLVDVVVVAALVVDVLECAARSVAARVPVTSIVFPTLSFSSLS